jgi:polysaccharide biosynthesis transport protein
LRASKVRAPNPSRPPSLPSSEPDIRHYGRVLRRHVLVIVTAAVIAPLVALAVTETESPTYKATMKVVVGQAGGVFQPQFGNAVDPFTQTMTNLFKSDVVARRTIARLGLPTTPDKLLGALSVSTTPQSSVLQVSYKTSNRDMAVKTLQAAGTVFANLVTQRLDQGSDTQVTATVFDDAHLVGQIGPRVMRNILIAAVLGLVFGVILALVRGALDRRIHTRRAAEDAFGARVIGTLPPPRSGRLASSSAGLGTRFRPEPDDRFLDALYLLRANLELSDAPVGSTLLVTSAQPEEGKTTLVANLGVALATAGRDVVCVEGDLRRPRLAQYLGAPPSSSGGLAQILSAGAPLSSVLEDVSPEVARRRLAWSLSRRHGHLHSPEGAAAGRLRLVRAGKTEDDPADMFSNERTADVVEQLRALDADYVIIDAPPLLLVADAYPFARNVDSVLVVAKTAETTSESAEAVQATLGALGIFDFGVVLTDYVSDTGYHAYEYTHGPNDTGETTATRIAAAVEDRLGRSAKSS